MPCSWHSRARQKPWVARPSSSPSTATRRRYTRTDVLRLAHGAGLEVLQATYWNAVLFPAVALVRRLRKSRAQTSQSDLRPISPRVNRLLYGFLRLEAAWLRHGSLPFGTSVLCVARKPQGLRPEEPP